MAEVKAMLQAHIGQVEYDPDKNRARAGVGAVMLRRPRCCEPEQWKILAAEDHGS